MKRRNFRKLRHLANDIIAVRSVGHGVPVKMDFFCNALAVNALSIVTGRAVQWTPSGPQVVAKFIESGSLHEAELPSHPNCRCVTK